MISILSNLFTSNQPNYLKQYGYKGSLPPENRKDLLEYADIYKNILESKVNGIKVSKNTDKKGTSYTLTAPNPSSLKVEIWANIEMSLAGIDIEGVDSGYWHTAENNNLDLYITLALEALKGNYRFNKSLLGVDEICFKTNKNWVCTRTSGSHSYHYIRTRNWLVRSKLPHSVH